MKTNTNEVMSYIALAAGSLALLDPQLVAAAFGPQAVVYLLLAKGATGAIVEAFKRVKAANAPDPTQEKQP